MLDSSWQNAKYFPEVSGIKWLLECNSNTFPLLTLDIRRLVQMGGRAVVVDFRQNDPNGFQRSSYAFAWDVPIGSQERQYSLSNLA